MTSTNNHIGLPAEWDSHNAILMAWPHSDTDWAPILPEAERCFAEIIRAIARYERVILAAPDVEIPRRVLADVDPARISFVECPTNDTWARDFGPITVNYAEGRAMLDFKFNGWGLKFAADRDNLITRRLHAAGVLTGCDYVNRLNFVLEGGSIESNGEGVVMTTSECLLSPNRNGEYSREEIDAYLRNTFAASRILWLDNGAISGDDTDSHIDTLARFSAPDTIIYVAPPADDSDPDYAGLAAMERELQATGLKLIALPYAGPVYDPADGSRLPATYANFLITPSAVIAPTYGLPTDDEALERLAEAFPGRDIVGVNCLTLTRQHGSLHCVTMQLYI